MGLMLSTTGVLGILIYISNKYKLWEKLGDYENDVRTMVRKEMKWAATCVKYNILLIIFLYAGLSTNKNISSEMIKMTICNTGRICNSIQFSITEISIIINGAYIFAGQYIGQDIKKVFKTILEKVKKNMKMFKMILEKVKKDYRC